MFGFLTHTFEQEIIFDIIVECYTVRAERRGHNIVDLETFQDGVRSDFYSRFTVSLVEEVELFDALLPYLSFGCRC